MTQQGTTTKSFIMTYKTQDDINAARLLVSPLKEGVIDTSPADTVT